MIKQVLKRFMAMLLSIIMVCLLLPTTAFAEENNNGFIPLLELSEDGGNWGYKQDEQQEEEILEPEDETEYVEAEENEVVAETNAVKNGAAMFSVGGTTYADLNAAIAAAEASSDKTVVVASDGSISGEYTIPAGVTLLVPFDDANTLYTDTPTATRTAAAAKAYRKLTLENGASIIVEGAISVGGQYYSAGGSQLGKMVGNYGYIWMESGSSITVKNGGALYAWGFISGDGSITANSGAKVYEWFQVGDFRGGTATSCMGNKVFPFSQYFIQNIEAEIVFEQGVTETVYTDIYAGDSQNGAAVEFIGENGMFKVCSGSFSKKYDPTTDRMIFTVNGEAELNTLSLKVGSFLKVNSSEYVLPITNNVTLNIESGRVTANQDISLLPGVCVNIEKDASLVIANGYKAYVYDCDEWNDQNYVNPNAHFKSVGYTPTKSYTRTDKDLIDATIKVDGTLVAIGKVYTTKGGANIYSTGSGRYELNTVPGTEITTYQYTQSGSNVTLHDITINAAWLYNADGTYEETKDKSAGEVIDYINGKWGKLPAEITITYNKNDGSDSPETRTQIINPGVENTLNGNEFEREGFEFSGWSINPEANPETEENKLSNGAQIAAKHFTSDVTLYALWSETVADVTITFDPNGGSGEMEQLATKAGSPIILTANAFTLEGYKFVGWNTVPNPTEENPGESYADEAAITLESDTTLYAQWQFWNGWFTDVNGKQYYKDGEPQKTGWTVIDGSTYYLDIETGYAATGLCELVPEGGTEEALCAFDADGVFQGDKTGLYDVGNDTYWINSGIIEEEAGLKRVVKENGEVNYYYFAVQKNLEERDGLTLSAAVKSTVLNGKDCWLHKTNGLALPEWGYYFDENGIILHDEDTGKNGILKAGEDLFYYVDGIKAPAGMIKIGDDYYYANSKGQLIVNQTYYCSRMNGLMEEGTYAFDAEGKLIQGATDKNGIVKDDDGVLRYYVNGKVTYVGLIEIDGDFYYVRSNGEVVTDCVYWITWTHGLKEAGYYTFNENGKLTGTPKNGIVEEDGVLHYYVNGTLTYAGLIKIGDDYYYVNSKCEVVRDCDYYISWTHDLMPQGRYHFDADGKLTGSVAPLKNGIYEEDGSLYFYRNGKRAYAGLIQIDGDYYYVRSTCEVVHDRSYYVYWTHGLMPEGYYNFDSAGRMILNG